MSADSNKDIKLVNDAQEILKMADSILNQSNEGNDPQYESNKTELLDFKINVTILIDKLKKERTIDKEDLIKLSSYVKKILPIVKSMVDFEGRRIQQERQKQQQIKVKNESISKQLKSFHMQCSIIFNMLTQKQFNIDNTKSELNKFENEYKSLNDSLYAIDSNKDSDYSEKISKLYQLQDQINLLDKKSIHCIIN